MRRSLGGELTLTVLTGAMLSVPAGAIDFGYLFQLQLEVGKRAQTPAMALEDPRTGVPPPARAAGAEKIEFDRICGQVRIAPELPIADLEQLIQDCLTLSEALQDSQNPQAKIWIQRLRMCREFFQYCIDLRVDS